MHIINTLWGAGPVTLAQGRWEPGLLEVPFEWVGLGVGLVVTAGLLWWVRRRLERGPQDLAKKQRDQRDASQG